MKMFHCIRFCISMFIVFTLCQVLESYISLRFSPIVENNKIVKEEGKVLFIKYQSSIKLKFVYPDAHEKSINLSKYNIKYYMNYYGIYTYEFRKPNITYRDTGWYGYTAYTYDSSTSSIAKDWFYVYVKSDTNLFVEADINVNLSAVVGGNVVIPCRTTSPDLKPILINGNEDKLNEMPFDPKIGFTITNLSLEDSNSYKCLIEKDGEEHTVNYILYVLKESLPEPKIQVNDLFITRGQDLKINCTIEMKSFMDPCEFDWNMPQKNNTRSIQQFTKHLDRNIVLVTSQLTIFNVTEKNSGDYECVVSSIYDIKKIEKRHIKIYNSHIKFIEFVPVETSNETVSSNTSYFQKQNGTDFWWIVAIRTIVEPYLQWFMPNGDEIMPFNEFTIEISEYYDSDGIGDSLNSQMNVSFVIKTLNIQDSGTYTLQAKTDYMIERINFTLDVIGKPISTLTRIDSNYLLNESIEFICKVTSNPPPKIEWSFSKYPNYPSLENSTTVHLMNATQSTANNSDYRFESIIKIPIEMSGKIICEACNDLDCDSKTEDIVIDPVPPFFVKTNMNETSIKIIDIIIGGHNMVILQCFVDGIPKPTVTWYKDNMLLKESNQYFFQQNHQELHIRYLTLQDSGNYSCRAVNRLGNNETYQEITVKNTKWNTLDIVLVTSISILGFILIILAFYFTIKFHHDKKVRKELMEVGLLNFEEGTLESLNPNLTVDEQAELLPYDKKWEFSRERLKLKEQLGSGNFGVVMKAEAIGICKDESVTTVAVKMVRRTTNSMYIHVLVSELKIMVHLGKHLNIVNLLGACSKNISKCELLVIVEYCHFGNLRDYLLRHTNHFVNQIDSKTGKFDFTICTDMLTRTINVNNDSLNANSNTDMMIQYCPRRNSNSSAMNFLPTCVLNSNSCQPEERSNYCDEDQNLKPIYTQDLLSWAFQVACGMEYLSQRKVLHADLAARNILLTENNIVKICDFSLAKKIYKYGYYKKKSNIPVPLKWMAIESIGDRVFSTQSDIWSFGIMLWEFFNLAETPYPGMEQKNLYQKLIEGYRMEQPKYATSEIYNIMLQCWEAKPMLRPNFTNLVERIGNLMEESVRMHYIILNDPYMDMNRMNLKRNENDYLMMMAAPDYVVL